MQPQACKCHMHHSVLKKWHLGICKHTLAWSPNWEGTSTTAMLGTGQNTCTEAAHCLRVCVLCCSGPLKMSPGVCTRNTGLAREEGGHGPSQGMVVSAEQCGGRAPCPFIPEAGRGSSVFECRHSKGYFGLISIVRSSVSPTVR